MSTLNEILDELKERIIDQLKEEGILEPDERGYRGVEIISAATIPEMKNAGWIPVEERLPEEDGEYLVTFLIDKKVRLVGYGCCRKDVLGNDIGFGWYDLYSGTYFSDKAFTAWMPLPEPYSPPKK